MKLQKILFVGLTETEFKPEELKELDSMCEERLMLTGPQNIPEHLDADALLVRLGAKVDKELIDQLPNLNYIGMLGTGYGGIDTEYAANKGITVTNIADYATEAVAEFTFGILLEHDRQIAQARQQAAEGNYSDDFSGCWEIKGKKFGVVGLGNIGRRTAELALAFGADVSYWSRNRKDDVEKVGIKYSDLDDLLASSDIVTLNLALNSETEDIINAERIQSLKKFSVFINPSPMELVEFDALVDRLGKGSFTFILDHSDEMTKEQLEALKPLSDNCIIYPPIGYITTEASELKYRIYIDNIKNYLEDKPTNKVN